MVVSGYSERKLSDINLINWCDSEVTAVKPLF